ncbi:MAG TPA: RNA 2',3'-cyclic phosphodiesterase, partial [Patescibacteria group bacterium]|nr:RNA 2',3'-cyclic phosphodiesterase [Patescibacteria group bacterium]
EPWMGRRDLEGLRWSDPSAWHLTLAFLGEIDASAVSKVVSLARGVAERHGPMRLPAAGVGAFPTPGRASVAWYGIGDPRSGLAALARDLGSELGVEVGDPFRPHVTLARARREPVDLRRWISDAAQAAPATIVVRRIELMRSHRGRGPAAYETLASIPLTGASA